MEPRSDFEKFRDDVFLSRHILNEQTVMEYFYSSRFFDTRSLNQKERKGLHVSNTEEGITYRLMYKKDAPSDRDLVSLTEAGHWNFSNQFGVFVIQKFLRDAKGTETPLECFYVLGGTIYKSPTLGALIRRRCRETVEHLDLLLESMTSMSSWSLIEGYTWGGAVDLDDNVATVEPDLLSAPQEPSQELPSEERCGPAKRRERVGSESQETSRINNLYTKRPCSDVGQIIERSFSAVAASSLRFNNYVDTTREAWQRDDKEWQEKYTQPLT